MIKNIIIICSVLSLLSGIIKHIICAAGGEKVAKVISAITVMLIIILIFQGFNNDLNINLSLTATDMHNHEKISQNVIDTVIKNAEVDIKNIICSDLYEKFGVLPTDCIVKLNKEKMIVETVTINFSNDASLLSAYEIKNYLYLKYSIDADVIFL